MAEKEYLDCVHGLIYQTCKLCKEKPLSEIHSEKVAFGDGSKKEKVKFEYQELIQPELDIKEVDTAYDLEDTGEY